MDENTINLMPGNLGKDCLYNGEHNTECCCDECDYLKCCIDESVNTCTYCDDKTCPRRINIVDKTYKFGYNN